MQLVFNIPYPLSVFTDEALLHAGISNYKMQSVAPARRTTSHAIDL
jgi:hypothetical protein